MYKDTIQDIKDELINNLKFYVEEENYKEVEKINNQLELINEIELKALEDIDEIINE